MNIEVQCCGLVIVLVLIFMNHNMQNHHALLYSGRLFEAVLYVSAANILFDILSMVAIYYRTQIPGWLLETACKTYIISLVFESTSALVYSSYDIYQYHKYRRFAYTLLTLDIIAMIVIAILPIRYNVMDEHRAYTEGPAVLATYISCLSVLIVTFYMIIVHGKRMNRQRRNAVALWLLSWLIAAGIQFANNSFLLVGFASAIGMTILFAILENPVAGLDRDTGVYSLPRLMEYMDQKFNRRQRFSALSLDFSNQAGEIESWEELRNSLVDYLKTFDNSHIFRNHRSGFTLLFKSETDMEDVLFELQHAFNTPWTAIEDGQEKSQMLSPTMIVLPDSTVAESGSEIMALGNYATSVERDEGKSVIVIDAQKNEERKVYEMRKNEMVRAMKEDHVEVFYQPIYSVERKEFVSAEALVRLRGEDGEIIPPGLFIPIAESTGHIIELGQTVFEKTCKFIRDEQPEQYGIDYIEVNLSVKQCEKSELGDMYQGIIEAYEIDPSRINLEITETSTIELRQNVMDNMQSLIGFGVNFSLDDFGNGQSNLDYIIDMPVVIVKFDRNMTKAFFENEKAHLVMETIIEMVHNLGLKIVVEGVEKKEQLDALADLGVEYIQGFYFSKPLPEAEFLEFIKENNVLYKEVNAG